MDRLKLPKTLALSLCLGLALIAIPVEAGTDSWTVAGQPYGGGVNQVLVDPTMPSTLYAVAYQQVFKSTDAGASWTLIISAPSQTLVGNIALDPQSPGTLYVVFGNLGAAPGNGTGEQGIVQRDPGAIYKSNDGGATWSQIDNGIGFDTNWETNGDGSQITDTLCRVAVDPVHEGVVYAGGCTSGMYRSTDGGAHWNPIDSGIGPASAVANQVTSIVVDPVNPAVLYVESSYSVRTSTSSSWGNYLYKSANSGQSWHALPLTATVIDADLVIDPTDHTHLLYCGYQDSEVSTDSGATWSPADCTGSGAAAIDPSNPAHVIAGTTGDLPGSVSESTDGGASFVLDPNVPPNGVGGFGSIAFDPVTPANVYLGSGSWGVLKSTDGGATWSSSTQGITGVHAGQMLEGSDGVVYMATGNSGIYKSLDQGATWAEVGTGITGSLPNVMDTFMSALVQDPSAPSTLYAGGYEDFYISTDGGDSWNLSMTGMPSGAHVDSVTIDPQAPATLYAGVGAGCMSGSHQSWCAGLYKSVDGGATWTSSSTGLSLLYGAVHGITVDPLQSAVVFAAADGDGVYKSVDGGVHWTLSLVDGRGDIHFYAVAVDPTDSNIVYASAPQSFFKSTDGGASWVESDTGMTLGSQVNANIQIDPEDTSILYVSPKYGFGQTYVSSDAGANWFALDSGVTNASSAKRRTTASRSTEQYMPASASAGQVSLGAVMIDPRNHKRIYAAGSDGVVYTYDDLHPPTATSTETSGGSGGTTTASSGGGGGFPWLLGLPLLFALTRRTAARRVAE